MPSKIQLDENLWFLYICLQKSDMKSIDFTAVGAATSLKPPAARMRYTRLRRQIESGTLIGTHGTPFASPAVPEDEKKSKGGIKQKRKRTLKTEPLSSNQPPTTSPSDLSTTTETKIKAEESSGYESSSSGESSDEESEDEMPLAKLSKRNPPISSAASYSQFAAHGLPVGGSNGFQGHGMGMGGSGFGMGGEMGRVGREQAELRAVIPTGRVVFDGVGVAGWDVNGDANEGGFWSQRYERDVVGVVGGDNKPRKSV